ncbi:SAVED domain-containing protein [Hyalangium rubrum]|uniref:SAVED domain-containing protein n=1 Tax=Hyalangium rubrum TaxID=3103134 RepID=A0ABU5HBJ4_9BACT|nr:SAVED domain-containing protein [Hyalangium sp. s54d21]MDY7230249.1 SAVED domain-containing protein [Hyalangium sp. s54d21]
MNQKNLQPPKGLILLSQPEQLRIEPAQMVDALPETFRTLHHPVVELDLAEFAREAIQTLDWSKVQRALEEQFHQHLAPLRTKHPDYPIVYFGSAPIPLAVQLGFLIETWQQVMIIPHHHTRRLWAWVPEPGRPSTRLLPVSMPSERDRSPGEAVIRVSTSHVVDPQVTRRAVPDALLEVDITLEHPSEDAFTREEEMLEVAKAFRETLNDIGDRFQGIHRVHLFASVQPGMALLLGAQISKTMHPPVQTYQYARHAQTGPYHVPAVVVNRQPQPEPAPLTSEEQTRASADREYLARDLDRMNGLAARWKSSSAKGWIEGLLAEFGKQPDFSGPWKHLPTLIDTPLLRTKVDVPTGVVEDSFRLAPPNNHWQIDDRWLARLARRLPDASDRQRALRLLVLHELAHRGPQSLTRTSSREIGRFPKVLEEIDFQADVWAMLHEYELTRLLNPSQVEDAPKFFMGLVRVATEGMWAFDDNGPAMREIQIRRLNRYLIWYWEYLHLERLDARSAGGSLKAVLSILAQRPTIELAGPTILTHDGRVFFALEPGRVRAPELAIYHEGQLRRHGPRPDFPIDALLEGVRERDGAKILDSLRGAFEQTVR